jgi:hypothetical protein
MTSVISIPNRNLKITKTASHIEMGREMGVEPAQPESQIFPYIDPMLDPY